MHQHNAMLKMHDGDATNTNSTIDDDDDDGFVDHESVSLRGIRRAPNSLDFSRKRKFASVKFQLPNKTDESLNEIIEECEYDSDIGKFKCKDDEPIEHDDSENSSTSSMVDHYLQVEHMNDLNSPFKCVNKNGLDSKNIENVEDAGSDSDSGYKIVMKRIEFFEKKPKEVEGTDTVDGGTFKADEPSTPTEADKLLSTILLSIFILTVALLIIFPLPN